jgi:hypothetical protein
MESSDDFDRRSPIVTLDRHHDTEASRRISKNKREKGAKYIREEWWRASQASERNISETWMEWNERNRS